MTFPQKKVKLPKWTKDLRDAEGKAGDLSFPGEKDVDEPDPIPLGGRGPLDLLGLGYWFDRQNKKATRDRERRQELDPVMWLLTTPEGLSILVGAASNARRFREEQAYLAALHLLQVVLALHKWGSDKLNDFALFLVDFRREVKRWLERTFGPDSAIVGVFDSVMGALLDAVFWASKKWSSDDVADWLKGLGRLLGRLKHKKKKRLKKRQFDDVVKAVFDILGIIESPTSPFSSSLDRRARRVRFGEEVDVQDAKAVWGSGSVSVRSAFEL